MSIKNALLLHLSGKKPNTGISVPAKAIAQQALEPRLLLDAAAVSTLAEATGDVANDDNLNSAIQQLGPPRLSEWDQWIAQYDSTVFRLQAETCRRINCHKGRYLCE